MHCSPLRSATLRLVDRQRTTAWQSAPILLVSTPTSAVSKNSTGCRIRLLNSSALRKPAWVLVSPASLAGLAYGSLRCKVPETMLNSPFLPRLHKDKDIWGITAGQSEHSRNVYQLVNT